MFICVLSFFTSLFPMSIYLLCKYVIGDDFSVGYIFQSVIYAIRNPVEFIAINPIKTMLLVIFLLEIISCIRLKRYIGAKFKLDKTHDDIYISNVRKDGTLTTQYLLSNVLPIITLELDEWYNVVFTIFLLIGLLVLYVRNNLFYMNPIFDFLHIYVYYANVCRIDPYSKERSAGKDIIIISDTRLTTVPCIIKAQFNNGIYVIRKKE